MKKIFNLFAKEENLQQEEQQLSIKMIFEREKLFSLSKEESELIARELENKEDAFENLISLSRSNRVPSFWVRDYLSTELTRKICLRWIEEELEWNVVTLASCKIEGIEDLMSKAIIKLKSSNVLNFIRDIFENYPNAYQEVKRKKINYDTILYAINSDCSNEEFFAEYPFWAEQAAKVCEEAASGELIKRVYPEVAKHAEGRESVKKALEILKEGYIKNIEKYLAAEE